MPKYVIPSARRSPHSQDKYDSEDKTIPSLGIANKSVFDYRRQDGNLHVV